MSSASVSNSDGGRRQHECDSRTASAEPSTPSQRLAPRSTPRASLNTDTTNTGSVSAATEEQDAEYLPSSVSASSTQKPIPNTRQTRPPSRDAAASPDVTLAKPSPSAATTTIDPLSQQILLRSNTEHSSSPRLRYPGHPDSPSPDPRPQLVSDNSAKHASVAPADLLREKKKGVSFLSRLNMRGRKKEDDLADDLADLGTARPDGTDARVFSSVVGSGGFIPHHKEPPRYIRTRAHNKRTREFNRMFLAQELLVPRPPQDRPDDKGKARAEDGPSSASPGRKPPYSDGSIWAAEFSNDGRYLAAAGKDGIVRVWAVISTRQERRQYEEEEAAASGASDERLSAPVFHSQPVREWNSHTGEVLALSWSKNNFLLSSSMDKTVRLWHVTQQDCLCTFKHTDYVTSIAFHPTDDRFFLAGCIDSVLRLWSIPDKDVAYSVELPHIITAVGFSPDGKTSIGGVLNGVCLFYDTEGLVLQTQMLVRSSRGKNAKGSKITGIKTAIIPPEGRGADAKVLITSNDSRIRMYNLSRKGIEMKLKGHENTSSQVHAKFSDDARYIVCGSEDKKVFVWSVDAPDLEKIPCEFFNAHSDSVTAAVFAPTKSRELLSASGDPIYDLCNPPPVKLMSLEETLAQAAAESQTALSDTVQQQQQKQQQPERTSQDKESDDPLPPQYLEKCKHPNGNILVTADRSGSIKVFRQDCAHAKRRHESWETGSSFSRKLINTGSGTIGRSGSIITRNSASSHRRSRRTSLSQFQLGASQSGSLAPGGFPQTSSDRVNTWRHSIGVDSNRNSLIGGSSVHRERSPSPSKPAPHSPLVPHAAHQSATLNANTPGAALEARKLPYRATSLSRPNNEQKQPSAPSSASNSPRTTQAQGRRVDDGPAKLPTPSFSLKPADEPEEDDSGAGNQSFWNITRWRGLGGLGATLSPTRTTFTANKRRSILSAGDAGESEASVTPTRERSPLVNGEEAEDKPQSGDDVKSGRTDDAPRER